MLGATKVRRGLQPFPYCKEHKDKTGAAAGRTLFLTNIPAEATQKDLKVFQQCGPVESVTLGRADQRDAKSSRFAHVVFKKSEALRKALQMPDTLAEEQLPRSRLAWKVSVEASCLIWPGVSPFVR